MNKNDFHIPFIKSLLIVAIVTVVAMVSSHYAVDFYIKNYKSNNFAAQYTHGQSTTIAK